MREKETDCATPRRLTYLILIESSKQSSITLGVTQGRERTENFKSEKMERAGIVALRTLGHNSRVKAHPRPDKSLKT